MTPETFQIFCELVKRESGLALKAEQTYLLKTRLQPIALAEGFETVDALAEAVRSSCSDALRGAIVESMTTNESYFFRDDHPFKAFKDVMLPAAMEARSGLKLLRIWCAACSSGQEPYSLAMLLRDEPLLEGWTTSIVATDISGRMIARAREGIYGDFEVNRGLPPEYRARYFQPEAPGCWRIAPELRRMVSFRQLNLLDDFSFLGTFDVVFCRNVLIYFDVETKADVLGRLADRMAPVSFLSLGAAETVVGITGRFRPLKGAASTFVAADNAGASPAAFLQASAGAS